MPKQGKSTRLDYTSKFGLLRLPPYIIVPDNPIQQNCSNCCHLVLLDKDESSPTADLSNIGRPDGPACSTAGELLNTPLGSFYKPRWFQAWYRTTWLTKTNPVLQPTMLIQMVLKRGRWAVLYCKLQYSCVKCQVHKNLYLAAVYFYRVSECHQVERRLLRTNLRASPDHTNDKQIWTGNSIEITQKEMTASNNELNFIK